MSALPDFLELSPEQLAQNKRQQDVLRRKFNSRLKMSAEEQERAQSLILEDTLKQSLNAIRSKKKSKIVKRQLAEAVAAQGRFTDAKALTDLVREKKYYQKINDAIWKDDEDLCKCEAKPEAVGGTLLQLPKFRVLKQIYSLRDMKMVNLLECNVCGEWNARDLTEDLIRINQVAEFNRTTDKNGQKRINDLELLKI